MEIRIAARSLRRTPLAISVIVLSLALGIAVTAVLLAVVNAYLVRSMPYPEAQRLYHVIYAKPGQPEPRGITLLDWKSLSDVVEIADAAAEARFYYEFNGYTQEKAGLLAAPGSMDLLGARVIVGRAFNEEDFRASSEPVALISSFFWRNQFASSPDVVGRQFQASVNDQGEPTGTFRIVGVLSPEFHWFREHVRGTTDIVVPARSPMRAYTVRLREGVPASAAAARITEATMRAATEIPPNWSGVELESVHERYVKELRPLLSGIGVAVSLLLVIVCSNVVVLMLLRSLRRQRDIAVRIAVGASRVQIARTFAAEVLLIAGSALVIGLILTKLALASLAPVIETQLRRPAPEGTGAIGLDSTVLFVVGGLGVAIAFVLSLVPLFVQTRLAEVLRRNRANGSGGRFATRIRSSLVAVEVAGALALLVSCGLMLRSMANLLRTDLGFQTQQVIRSRLVLPARTYPHATALLNFYEKFLDRFPERSGTPAALANFPSFYEPIRHPVETSSGLLNGGAGVVAVTGTYFDLLGIPLTTGRSFTPGDRLGSEPVAIVSEALAARLWPRQNPVGQRLRTAEQTPAQSPLTVWRTVVGVTRNIRQTYNDEDLSDIYIPFLQAPNQYAPLYIRANQPPASVLSMLQAAVAEIDRGVMIGETTALSIDRERQLTDAKFLTAMLTGFAAFAALLVVLGIYGVTAYAAQQKKHEVAIRSALGATRASIVSLFLKDSAVALAVGVAGGLFAASITSRIVASQLHGVEPLDLPTLAAAAALIISIGLAATLWPASRAAVRNPIAALKDE